MKFSAEQRQRILQQCSLHDRFNGLCAVSRRWGLSPDGKTLQRWFRQWDGTVESLKERSHHRQIKHTQHRQNEASVH